MNEPRAQAPSIFGVGIVIDKGQDPRTCTIINAAGKVVGKIINIGATNLADTPGAVREATIQRLLDMPAALAQGYDRKTGLCVWIEDNLRDHMDPKEDHHGSL